MWYELRASQACRLNRRNYTPVWGIYHPNWTASINAITHRSYQPVINLGIINPLMLKHAWQVELNYDLVTTGNPEWNKRLTTCSHNLTAAVQKSFLKDNALTLRLEARDTNGCPSVPVQYS